jgi:hypothetical protein
VNCTILFLHPNEDLEKVRELQESQIKNSEKGIITALDELRSVFIAGFPFWNKVNMFKKIQDIGIDLAICDPSSAPCAAAVHNLKIAKSLYLAPTCYPGVFSTIHQRDSNRIPFETLKWPTGNLQFFDRMLNALKCKGFNFFFERLYDGIGLEYVKYNDDNDWRSNSLHKREALFVEPCIPFVNIPELLPPNYIHSGPLINREINLLPETILEFLNLFKQNIYVSFGSISITYDLSQILILAQKLPDVGFIISYSKKTLNSAEIPKNCLVLPWVPQTDLLASGKVDIFITHSGWNSFCESVFYGVPMITCGWSIDRMDNAFLVELRKIGKAIQNKEEFTADNLLIVIQDVLNNPIYKQNSLKYSKMLQKWDSEGKIIDAIKLYFEMGIENLVMENYYDLYWFQKCYLDIYVFCLGIFGFVVWIVFLICRILWRGIKKAFFRDRRIKDKND